MGLSASTGNGMGAQSCTSKDLPSGDHPEVTAFMQGSHLAFSLNSKVPEKCYYTCTIGANHKESPLGPKQSVC